MPDIEPSTSPADTGRPTTVISHSGGVDIDAQHDVTIGGDVTGRDKITQIINNFFQGDTAQRDLRNRRNMLERVKNDWVKGVLEKSLYHEVMLDLGLEERPDEVQHPWDMTLQMPERENRVLPPGTKIMQVFEDANHALLILGEPGSGKTTMLLELARDTIARAEQDPTQPIPVVFNLSSWSADPRQSIADWLVQELHDKYDVHKKIAQPWIDNDDLLLLLDGLDEVKAEHREACVRAINYFRSEHGQTVLAMCSRIADYEALVTRLRLHGAILIKPLTPMQIDEYLEQAGHELVAVRKALSHDTELQELAQSPLMLGIMTLVYRGSSVEAIDVEPRITLEARRRHLFDTYVQHMFMRVARTKNEIYSKDQAMRSLTWLGLKLSKHGQSTFLLDQMQITWLPNKHVQRRYRSLVRIIYGVAIGMNFGVIGGTVVGVLICGLVGGLIGRLDESLVPSEWRTMALKWSWKKAMPGLMFVFIGGLVSALGNWLASGLTSIDIQTRTSPDQFIRQSIKNAIIIWFGFGLLGVLLFGRGWWMFAGLALGLKFGGMAAISHFIIRFNFYRSGDMPWGYVRFLDYATERIFLRKVGGGYAFIHRMLMEYFAPGYNSSSYPPRTLTMGELAKDHPGQGGSYRRPIRTIRRKKPKTRS